jgi:excalibur calcium-binding domain-containing protein
MVTLTLDRNPPRLRTVPTKPPEPPARETTKPNPLATSQPPERATSSVQAPGANPRFGTCREANAHGYEDYRQGVAVEYDWYEDRDGDGQVCERR